MNDHNAGGHARQDWSQSVDNSRQPAWTPYAIDDLLGDPSDSRTVLIGHGEMDRRIGAFRGNDPANTDLPEGYAITVNGAKIPATVHRRPPYDPDRKRILA